MRRKDREVTEMEEIQQIFDECKVCRIGIMDENGPYIVPVNYGYVREEGKVILYIHGAREGKKIDLIRKNANVGVEIDYRHELVEGDTACQYSYYYASIIGKGAASIIDNPREKLKALNVIMEHQTGEHLMNSKKNPNLEKAVAIIRIDLNEYSCKNIYKKPCFCQINALTRESNCVILLQGGVNGMALTRKDGKEVCQKK